MHEISGQVGFNIGARVAPNADVLQRRTAAIAGTITTVFGLQDKSVLAGVGQMEHVVGESKNVLQDMHILDSLKHDRSFRGDHDVFDKFDKGGCRKSYLNENGDLIPNSIEGPTTVRLQQYQNMFMVFGIQQRKPIVRFQVLAWRSL